MVSDWSPNALIEFKCDVFFKTLKNREFRNSLYRGASGSTVCMEPTADTSLPDGSTDVSDFFAVDFVPKNRQIFGPRAARSNDIPGSAVALHRLYKTNRDFALARAVEFNQDGALPCS